MEDNNMSGIDRLIRIGIAILFIILHYAHVISGTAAILLAIVAVALLLTAFMGFCPLYEAFHIHSNKNQTDNY